MSDRHAPEPRDEIYVAGYADHEQLDPADTLAGELGDDPLDAGYTLPDREPVASRWPTTQDEELRGESLDRHLAEEEPDVWESDESTDFPGSPGSPGSPEPRAGRLVSAHDNDAFPHGQDQLTARDTGRAGWAASAEEAAMHITRRHRG